MMDINKAADIIIYRIIEGGGSLSTLKLHKLLYYVQAWHIAFYGKRLFDEDFQAWIHGPVNRKVYDRFKDSKMLYSELTLQDIENDLSDMKLNDKQVVHIEQILENYGSYSGTQLEILTHRELPWQKARVGVLPNHRCENIIDDDIMKEFYSQFIN